MPAAVLKGPAVARAYRDPAQRTFTDLDLLVPAAQLEEALRVLSSHPHAGPLPPRGPRADKRTLPFFDPSGVTFDVDLHWDLFSYRQLLGAAEGASEWAWRRALGPRKGHLGPLWELPEEVELAFLCTHALFDHRFRLVLFRDLLELSARGVDWEALGRFVDRWGLRSACYLALLIAREALGAAVPEGVPADLRPRGAALAAAKRLLPRTDLVRFDGHRPALLNLAVVLLHDRWWGRARLLARTPLAVPGWLRRVGPRGSGSPTGR